MLMMIDETDRTFKEGMIVSATVVNVADQKAFCKLENGLKATIEEKEICENSN
jgi:ribosomal protein S1